MESLPSPSAYAHPDVCQRWRDGRDRYRPSGETMDTKRHRVILIDESDARNFVMRHHYSRSWIASRLRVGLLRKERLGPERLAGVIAFGVPCQANAIPRWTGLPAREGVELSRMILLDEVEAMAETWMLARAMRLLAERLPEIGAVISYSDAVPRVIRDADGSERILKPGHLGLIYSAYAGTAAYRGRSRARRLWVTADGRVLSERTRSKILAGDRGREGGLRQLRDMGAPSMRTGEEPAAYLARVAASGLFHIVRHPGNHCFVFPAGKAGSRRRLRNTIGPGLPRPRSADPAILLREIR